MELASKYPNNAIHVTILDKIYNLKITQGSGMKMYLATAISRGEACSLCFGIIGTKFDVKDQIQMIIEKMERKFLKQNKNSRIYSANKLPTQLKK